jgi:hypothetical protein
VAVSGTVVVVVVDGVVVVGGVDASWWWCSARRLAHLQLHHRARGHVGARGDALRDDLAVLRVAERHAW